MKRVLTVLSLCFALAHSGLAQNLPPNPPPPPTGPVTMQQAVEQVLAHNPLLLAAQQNLLSMKGQEVQAGIRANPYLVGAGSDASLPPANPTTPHPYPLVANTLFNPHQN